MRKTTFSLWPFPRLLALVSCTILFSFATHDIQLNHIHHYDGQEQHSQKGESTHSIFAGNYLHASDKKMFFFIFLTFISFIAGIVTVACMAPYWLLRLPVRVKARRLERHDSTIELFRIGIFQVRV